MQDHKAEQTPDHEHEEVSKADRGIPSVAKDSSKSQLIGAAALLILACLAIIVVILDGMQKNAPVPVLTAEEIRFRSPPGSALPHIEPAGGMQERLPLNRPLNRDEQQSTPAIDPERSRHERALQEEALRMAKAQQQKMNQRLHSSQLVFDQPATANNSALQAPPGLPTAAYHEDANVAFAAHYGQQDTETIKARQLSHLDALIPQGTLISGILETAIQSDLPGMVRAVVSENVYAFDSTQLLIPKGTRLIGRYRSGLSRGQSRVFIIWTRLIRHDGVSINIGSYGTDDLGRASLGGDLDTHFFERFGASVLLSLIDTGLKAGAQSIDNAQGASLAIQTGNDFSGASEIALEHSIAIPPTVHIDQGARINVFVGKDLDFSQIRITN